MNFIGTCREGLDFSQTYCVWSKNPENWRVDHSAKWKYSPKELQLERLEPFLLLYIGVIWFVDGYHTGNCYSIRWKCFLDYRRHCGYTLYCIVDPWIRRSCFLSPYIKETSFSLSLSHGSTKLEKTVILDRSRVSAIILRLRQGITQKIFQRNRPQTLYFVKAGTHSIGHLCRTVKLWRVNKQRTWIFIFAYLMHFQDFDRPRHIEDICPRYHTLGPKPEPWGQEASLLPHGYFWTYTIAGCIWCCIVSTYKMILSRMPFTTQ